MGTTYLIYFLDDTTEVTARDLNSHPDAMVAKILTGQAEITLHGDHAQLTLLAATLTEQLAQLAPELAAS